MPHRRRASYRRVTDLPKEGYRPTQTHTRHAQSHADPKRTRQARPELQTVRQTPSDPRTKPSGPTSRPANLSTQPAHHRPGTPRSTRPPCRLRPILPCPTSPPRPADGAGGRVNWGSSKRRQKWLGHEWGAPAHRHTHSLTRSPVPMREGGVRRRRALTAA
jgi:hypothetical protein